MRSAHTPMPADPYCTPGATLWALRMQVKRNRENGIEEKVPYDIVLAYAKQAAEEAAEPLRAQIVGFKFRLVSTAAFFTGLGALLGWLASGVPS